MNKLFARIPLEAKDDGLVVGYANKAVVDRVNDLIPAEAWFTALSRFFKEGMPVKLLHRPELVVADTVWLRVEPDGLVLASRPRFPEILGLIKRGLLRAYSVGFIPKSVKVREDGVRVIEDLELVEVSYVDEPANQECFFMEVRMSMDKKVTYDAASGRVIIEDVSAEEMAGLVGQLKELLVKAGVPEGFSPMALEFKMSTRAADLEKALGGMLMEHYNKHMHRDPQRKPNTADEEQNKGPATPEVIVTEEDVEEEDVDLDDVDWDEVFTNYYKMLDGEKVPEEKEKWTRRYINRLPDSSFAVIEPAYERGETKDKNCRHLPHHGPGGGGTKNVNLDLPHLRNAFARAPLIKPVTDSISTEELRRRAMEHLENHRSALDTYQEERMQGGLLRAVKALLDLVRGEKTEEKPAEEGKMTEKFQALEGKLAELAQKAQAEAESRKALEAKLGELEAALLTLTEVVKSIVPPQRSKAVVDTGAEEQKPRYKWGIFGK